MTSGITLNKISPPANPAAGVVSMFYSSGVSPAKLVILDSSGNILVVGGLTVKDYRLVKLTTISNVATTSYTPTSGVTALLIACIGGGGAGGRATTAVTNSAAAGGGGGGALSLTWSTTLVEGAHTIAIGAAGVGGNPGTNGGDTSFKDTASTTICLAKGGSVGGGDTVATIHVGGLGGAGGLASGGTGDVKYSGQSGRTGIALAAAQAISGSGAPGYMGFGGVVGYKNLTSVGATPNALNWGSGGAGACIVSGGATSNGGNGVDGAIIIMEYA